MKIRKTHSKDYDQIHTVITTAFGGTVEAGLVEALRQDGNVEISLVAELDGKIVGHIVLSKMTAPVRALGLAPVSVLPQYQNKGVGGKLVLESLKLAKSANWQAVFLLGHADYYPRFGFSPELAKPFTSPYAGPNFMTIELQEGVLENKSGAVDYAPAFAAL